MAVHRTDRAGERRLVRLEALIGRNVHAVDDRVIGRLEEVRVEANDGRYAVTEYLIGPAGLLERLGLGVKYLVGRRGSGYRARWDQLDLTDPRHPRLTCPLAELTREE